MKKLVLFFALFLMKMGYSQYFKIPTDGQLCLVKQTLYRHNEDVKRYFELDSTKEIDFILMSEHFFDKLIFSKSNLILLNTSFGTDNIVEVLDSLKIINDNMHDSILKLNPYESRPAFNANCLLSNEGVCFGIRVSLIINDLFTIEIREIINDPFNKRYKETPKVLYFTFGIEDDGDIIGYSIIPNNKVLE